MKPTALLFLIGQLLDIYTTALGLSLGFVEMNAISLGATWGELITAKLIVAIGVTCILQIKRYFWINWIPIAITWIVVAWNLLNILVR